MSNNGNRECPTCPAFVVRCAHFDEQRVWLIDGLLPCSCEWCIDKDEWSVLGPAEVGDETGCMFLWDYEGSTFPRPQRPAANAEFDRRELELLGREAP